jgi:hypothetical protein
MKRRKFIKGATILGVGGLFLPKMGFSSSLENSLNSGELLYNGIKLPEVWPPKSMNPASYNPMPVPYLGNRPEIVPINVGRQLFVDDFLIESTDMKRVSHKARKLNSNPVLKPETKLEQGLWGVPGASAKDGGVWWDPNDKLFKMWYEAGWLHSMAYAVSKDGIHWERPNLDIEPGTNRLVPDIVSDSSTVWLDHYTENQDERFKMFLRSPNTVPGINEHFNYGFSMVSPDGIHWGKPVKSGTCGDRSTFFYNPFRKKWVYSIRNGGNINIAPNGRCRYYHEHDDFLKGAAWEKGEPVYWTGADNLDIPDPYIDQKPQLYNLSAVGYESLMLGLHQIHLGPTNEVCVEKGVPKITELMTSFSRDGFHWHRPEREAFIPAERKQGYWDRGYVQSVGGICAIVGDQLWFYYIGFGGNSKFTDPEYAKNGMHSNGSTGIAVLRRDGFMSMKAGDNESRLTTRPVTFDGEYLFVNVDCQSGQLKVEILDHDCSVIAPFSASNCLPVSADSTIKQISWKGAKNLALLKNKPVRFRFHLVNGDLYSFWVSPDKTGASRGYNAAGGPGFNGGVDLEGSNAYKQASNFPNLLNPCYK